MANTGVYSVEGYTVVKLKFKEESEAAHQLLWKKHAVRKFDPMKPAHQTLFVVNVPPYCTKKSFIKLFERYGKVVRVIFQAKPTIAAPPYSKYPNIQPNIPINGCKVAYIVFKQGSSVKAAM